VSLLFLSITNKSRALDELVLVSPQPKSPKVVTTIHIILEWVIIIPSILSVFGCLFILISYFTFVKLRSSVGIFVLWFALCGLGNSLYPFLGSPSDGTVLCYLQSIVGTYFLLSNVFTSTILSHLLYSIFHIPSYPMIKISRYHYFYSWCLPMIFTALPFITSSYGRDDDRFTIPTPPHILLSIQNL
jgi:hypothetical protein